LLELPAEVCAESGTKSLQQSLVQLPDFRSSRHGDELKSNAGEAQLDSEQTFAAMESDNKMEAAEVSVEWVDLNLEFWRFKLIALVAVA